MAFHIRQHPCHHGCVLSAGHVVFQLILGIIPVKNHDYAVRPWWHDQHGCNETCRMLHRVSRHTELASYMRRQAETHCTSTLEFFRWDGLVLLPHLESYLHIKHHDQHHYTAVRVHYDQRQLLRLR